MRGVRGKKKYWSGRMSVFYAIIVWEPYLSFIFTSAHNNAFTMAKKKKPSSNKLDDLTWNDAKKPVNYRPPPKSKSRLVPLFSQPLAITKDTINSALSPTGTSSVVQIYDRRIWLENVNEETSLYELGRRWVQDDPYRINKSEPQALKKKHSVDKKKDVKKVIVNKGGGKRTVKAGNMDRMRRHGLMPPVKKRKKVTTGK